MKARCLIFSAMIIPLLATAQTGTDCVELTNALKDIYELDKKGMISEEAFDKLCHSKSANSQGSLVGVGSGQSKSLDEACRTRDRSYASTHALNLYQSTIDSGKLDVVRQCLSGFFISIQSISGSTVHIQMSWNGADTNLPVLVRDAKNLTCASSIREGEALKVGPAGTILTCTIGDRNQSASAVIDTDAKDYVISVDGLRPLVNTWVGRHRCKSPGEVSLAIVKSNEPASGLLSWTNEQTGRQATWRQENGTVDANGTITFGSCSVVQANQSQHGCTTYSVRREPGTNRMDMRFEAYFNADGSRETSDPDSCLYPVTLIAK